MLWLQKQRASYLFSCISFVCKSISQFISCFGIRSIFFKMSSVKFVGEICF